MQWYSLLLLFPQLSERQGDLVYLQRQEVLHQLDAVLKKNVV
jgi:hypothetical protein